MHPACTIGTAGEGVVGGAGRLVREGMSRRQHSRMLDRERACKKVGPSVAILDPVHDAKGADSQVRIVASRL